MSNQLSNDIIIDLDVSARYSENEVDDEETDDIERDLFGISGTSERARFELATQLPVLRFSRATHSTTLASLHRKSKRTKS